jgi:putative FmdB family regulatory protein
MPSPVHVCRCCKDREDHGRFEKSRLKYAVSDPSCSLLDVYDETIYRFRLEIKEVQMPTFEYACKDCGKEFTIFLSIKEYEANPKIKCPHCNSDHVERKFTSFSAKTSRKS